MTDTPIEFERLVAYAAGELDPAAVESLERALHGSPNATAEAERLRDLLATLAASSGPSVSMLP